ncbi:hypothetical protein [Flavobacterium sp. LB1P62]|uniref:hypothetical protein n=1 Tax=Flavobacterium sp. LB1P62 TaxID=3401715 RepID=UPI003AAB3370
MFFAKSEICSAQVYEEPPKMAMPSEENKDLINRIIKITEYNKYFEKVCLDYLKNKVKTENWSKEKYETLKNNINLERFKYKIFNTLSNYNSEQLKDLIKKYENNKKSQNRNLLIENKIIDEGLKSHVKFNFS